jgi:hypothetical protein
MYCLFAIAAPATRIAMRKVSVEAPTLATVMVLTTASVAAGTV